MQARSQQADAPEYKIDSVAFASGSYGSVYRATDPKGKPCVVKKVLDMNNYGTLLRILREIYILRLMRCHPHIVELKDIMPTHQTIDNLDTLDLVFGKMDSDLCRVLSKPQVFSDLHIQTILFGILAGVSYLHSAGVVHRDLKPANILINTADCHVRVCDFNMAKLLFWSTPGAENSKLKNNGITGSALPGRLVLSRERTQYITTRWYRAPEVILLGQNKYDFQVDVWAIGCMLAELLMMQADPPSHKALFEGDFCNPFSPGPLQNEPRDQLDVIFDILGTPTLEDIESIKPANAATEESLKKMPVKPPKNFREIFSYVKNRHAIDFLEKCLVINPQKRMRIHEALSHPFVVNVRQSKRVALTFLPWFQPELDKRSFEELRCLEAAKEDVDFSKRPGLARIRQSILNEVQRYRPAEVKQDIPTPPQRVEDSNKRASVGGGFDLLSHLVTSQRGQPYPVQRPVNDPPNNKVEMPPVNFRFRKS